MNRPSPLLSIGMPPLLNSSAPDGWLDCSWQVELQGVSLVFTGLSQS